VTERLHDLVSFQAERRPDAVAVVMREERLTYGQLDALSNQLARILRKGGGQAGDRVALLVPKSPVAIVGMLGIYKADGIVVPLDTSSPPARLAKIVRSCEPRWLLAAGPVAGLLDEVLRQDGILPPAVGWLDDGEVGGERFAPEFSLADLSNHASMPPDSRATGQDPAHILYTSGSTGTPKGVVITHSNVLHFVAWAVRHFGMGPADRMSGHSPLHFDLSTFDIFGTFAAGAQLHLVPAELGVMPAGLADFIRASGLTQWFSVPSVLSYMAAFDVVGFGDFPALRRLLWCGEVLPTPVLVHWMTRLPHVSFTNLYGPSEATIASSHYTVPACPADERAEIPIGRACDGEGLLVLDAQLRPVPPGEVGELCIRGVGLSPGYWRDPEQTDAAFVRDPRRIGIPDRIYRTGDLARLGDDGLVYFVGRADTQIKSRGYRIELGEVEAALNAVEGVSEGAVVAIDTPGFEGARICGAYVTRPDVPLPPAMVRTRLRAALPAYMIPSRWRRLDGLPRNANGKIDRPALKALFRAMKLVPLDRPDLIDLVAGWLAAPENAKWLDFGTGTRVLTPVALRVMTQRNIHLLRGFMRDGDERPIGVVALGSVDRAARTATVWFVRGDKRTAGDGATTRAVSRLLSLGFGELGLEAVSAWAVETNVPSIRLLERLNFRYVGRLRRCHYIDGRPLDRLLFDLLASEHRQV
jgi:amino acid adenylation domain-containing protein